MSDYHSSNYFVSKIRFERQGNKLIPVKVLSIPSTNKCKCDDEHDLIMMTVIRVTELAFPLSMPQVSLMTNEELEGWHSFAHSGVTDSRKGLKLKGLLKEAGYGEPCLLLDLKAWESHDRNDLGVPSPYLEPELDISQEAA